jgi:drug/metabolite transporter (DMT)-like permease
LTKFPSPSARPGDLAALVGGGLAWGLAPTFTKLAGTTGIGVLVFSAAQSGIAALLLGALALATGRRLPLRAGPVAYCLFAGIVGMALPNILLFLGLRQVPAGFFALLAPVSPVLTALLLGLSGRERVDAATIAGSVLATAGAVMAMLPGAALPDREALGWAAALLLVPVAYAVTNVAAAIWRPPGLDGLALAAGTLGSTALVMLPLAGLAGQLAAPLPVWAESAPWLLAQGAVQAVAFALYFRNIVARGGVFASQVAYVITLSGIAWGALVFAERPGWLTLPAVALVCLGLWLVSRPR